MNWSLQTSKDFQTTAWSGGTTTQLAIEPMNANYANRDFLWRLSSANVAVEHSDFTPLGEYQRILAPLDTDLTLQIDQQDKITLQPMHLLAFDGGAPVQSWGQCTDYNLMVRKGAGQGIVQRISLCGGACYDWHLPTLTATKSAAAVMLYCTQGDCSIVQAGLTAHARELLLCRDCQDDTLSLTSETGAQAMLTVVYSCT